MAWTPRFPGNKFVPSPALAGGGGGKNEVEDEGKNKGVDEACFMTAQLESGVVENNNNTATTLVELLCFGLKSPVAGMVWGKDLPVSLLPIPLKRTLASLLDPYKSLGRDWCMLAVLLGLLPSLDSDENFNMSRTIRVLEEWKQLNSNCTVGTLIGALRRLQRDDVNAAILHEAPLFRVMHCFDDKQCESNAAASYGSAISSSNLSR